MAKPGSGLANIVTNAGYDATCANVVKCNKPNWTQDALGNQTDYTYDPTHGGVLTVTAPAPSAGATRPQSRSTYTALQAYYKNSSGSIVASGSPIYVLSSTSMCRTSASCAGTADETKSTVGFGTFAAGTPNNILPVSGTTGAGDGSLTATVALTYDNVGNAVTVDGPLLGTGDTARIIYDGRRRTVGSIGPDPDGAGSRVPIAQRVTYNLDNAVTLSEVGTVTDQSDAAWSAFSSQQQSSVTYDTNGRPIQSQVTAGGVVYGLAQTSYDTLGRADCSAVRMNPAVYGSLPDACTLSTQGANGADRISRNTYDLIGRVTKVTTGYGTTVQADSATSSFTANGQLAYVVDANSNRTSYTYDGFDRRVTTNFPSPTKGANASNAGDYEQLTYNANGAVTQRRQRDGTIIGFSYDNLGRAYYKARPGTDPSITYTYDLVGNLTGASYPGFALTFTYDALGRRTSETGPLGTMTNQFDIAGRRTAIVWPDAAVTSYGYDTVGAMQWINEGVGSGNIMNTYTYDSLGRRAGLNRRYGANTSYSYDSLSRLTSIGHDLAGTANDITIGSMSYNPAGQLASISKSNDSYAYTGAYNVDRLYTTNGLNQYTNSGGVSLAYDGRGNLTTSGTSTYTYDSENNLVSGPGVTVSYDPLGRLYQIAGPSGTTRLQYDGMTIAAEYDGSNNRLRRYVPGPGADEPAFWYEGAGIGPAKWYHTDERGSVIALSDYLASSVGTNRYDEFGIPQGGNVGRFEYTGQAWFGDLGLYYYKARWYSPTLGRFMQTDPIGYGDGLNWYNYAHGDPVNGSDPSGLANEGPNPSVLPVAGTGTNIAGGTCGSCNVVSVDGPAAQMNSATNNKDSSNGGNNGSSNAASFSGVTGDMSQGVAQRGIESPGAGYIIVNASIYPSSAPANGNGIIYGTGSVSSQSDNSSTITVTARRVTLSNVYPMDLFRHFIGGSGDQVCLTSSQFNALLLAGKSVGAPVPRAGGGYAQQFNLYNTPYANSFGTATLLLDSERSAVGFHDYYDFDAHARSSWKAQVMTGIGAIAGFIGGGKNFPVDYRNGGC